MELIRGLHNILPRHRGCVATIGNFDGVHLGHQRVLTQLETQAKRLQLPGVVIIFEPHPIEFFSPQKTKARLTRLREKLIFFQDLGVERVLCIAFNRAFAEMRAAQFVSEVLIEKLGIRFLVVGDDFRFGYRREGDFALLQAVGQQQGFEVASTDTVMHDARRISSSWVREVLASGDLKTAEVLLGRSYSMCGRVAHGDKLGRKLGFPTANIYLHRKLSPIAGIFAVKVWGLEGEPLYGVANVGNRPTVGGTRSLLEVYLFDFDQDIYGRYVKVDFIHKLRDEEKYATLELLRDQIAQDVIDAQRFFGR